MVPPVFLYFSLSSIPFVVLCYIWIKTSNFHSLLAFRTSTPYFRRFLLPGFVSYFINIFILSTGLRNCYGLTLYLVVSFPLFNTTALLKLIYLWYTYFYQQVQVDGVLFSPCVLPIPSSDNINLRRVITRPQNHDPSSSHSLAGRCIAFFNHPFSPIESMTKIFIAFWMCHFILFFVSLPFLLPHFPSDPADTTECVLQHICPGCYYSYVVFTSLSIIGATLLALKSRNREDFIYYHHTVLLQFLLNIGMAISFALIKVFDVPDLFLTRVFLMVLFTVPTLFIEPLVLSYAQHNISAKLKTISSNPFHPDSDDPNNGTTNILSFQEYAVQLSALPKFLQFLNEQRRTPFCDFFHSVFLSNIAYSFLGCIDWKESWNDDSIHTIHRISKLFDLYHIFFDTKSSQCWMSVPLSKSNQIAIETLVEHLKSLNSLSLVEKSRLFHSKALDSIIQDIFQNLIVPLLLPLLQYIKSEEEM